MDTAKAAPRQAESEGLGQRKEGHGHQCDKVDPEKLQRRKSSYVGSSQASLHAKFFGFDHRYLFVGSFNLDARSVALNTELGAYFESPAHAQQLSRSFREKARQMAYEIVLDDDGKLVWLGESEGQAESFQKEPDTTGWQRFSARVMSWFVPESQL